MKLKNRARVSKKELKLVVEALNQTFGKEILTGKELIDKAETDDISVLIINNEILGFSMQGKYFLTLKGLLKYKPESKYITVDMGAVKAIAGGADLMAPGIVTLDKTIQSNEFVWIRDSLHKKPLAVGVALRSASEMLTLGRGKAVRSIHHIGDKLWEL